MRTRRGITAAAITLTFLAAGTVATAAPASAQTAAVDATTGTGLVGDALGELELNFEPSVNVAGGLLVSGDLL